MWVLYRGAQAMSLLNVKRILVVEDQVDLAMTIGDYLSADGHKVQLCHNGQEAIDQFNLIAPDLVILDISLPDTDGMKILSMIRQTSKIPVLMLSARSNDVDKIFALGLGADDYITKPFSPGELVARVRAHIRRYTEFADDDKASTETRQLQFDGLIIDPRSYTVTIDNVDAGLVAKEFELLYFLAKNYGQVFTKEQLFDRIWGYDSLGDMNTVTVHIRRIRKKIEKSDEHNKHIKTVWGVGYKFDG